MKRRDTILVLIAGLCEESALGRTSLQKAAYFLDARKGIGYRHSAHYYGPYSSTVEAEVSALVSSGLVEETEHRLGFIGPQGFEGRKYTYDLTESGRSRLSALREVYDTDVEDIELFSHELQDLVPTLDQQKLSAAAKVHYIENRERQSLSSEEVVEIASQFGWRLGKATVESVRQLSERLATHG
jgi:uncharacterized protein YwgA